MKSIRFRGTWEWPSRGASVSTTSTRISRRALGSTTVATSLTNALESPLHGDTRLIIVEPSARTQHPRLRHRRLSRPAYFSPSLGLKTTTGNLSPQPSYRHAIKAREVSNKYQEEFFKGDEPSFPIQNNTANPPRLLQICDLSHVVSHRNLDHVTKSDVKDEHDDFVFFAVTVRGTRSQLEIAIAQSFSGS